MNIRIYALKRDHDVQKAERFFKERRISYQFVDLNKTDLGLRELESICRAVGLDSLIRLSDKDWESHYIAQLKDTGEALNKLRQNPRLINLPIVRNGNDATVGHTPDKWAAWVEKG